MEFLFLIELLFERIPTPLFLARRWLDEISCWQYLHSFWGPAWDIVYVETATVDNSVLSACMHLFVSRNHQSYSHLIHHKCHQRWDRNVYIAVEKKYTKSSCSDVNNDIFPVKNCKCDIELLLKWLPAEKFDWLLLPAHLHPLLLACIFRLSRGLTCRTTGEMLFQLNINSIRVDKRCSSLVEKSLLFDNFYFSYKKSFRETQLKLSWFGWIYDAK